MNMKNRLILLLSITALLCAQTPADISFSSAEYISTYGNSLKNISKDQNTTLKISSTESGKFIKVTLNKEYPQIILSEDMLNYLEISADKESLIRISPCHSTDYSALQMLFDSKSHKTGYGQGSCRYGIVTNVYKDRQSANYHAKEMNDIYHIFSYAQDICEADQTYYCVIAGNFKTREAAKITLERIRSLNPNAYIVEI